MTRAEMRRAAQGKGRGGGRGKGRGAPPSGPKPKRIIDYPRWGKTGVKRWIPSWKQVSSGVLVMVAALFGLIGYAYANVELPTENAALKMQSNTYLWNDGSLLARRGTYYRENVTLDQIPMAVQNDFIAAENETFWTDKGIDPQGILRAVYKMAQGGDTQSGSTITQQYIKNAYLDSNQTLTRKFNEILLSVKINQTMSKQKILENYLNGVYFGRGAYGIQAAAKTYYGIDAKKLTVSQGAFLAALVNGPSLYDPYGADETGTNAANNKVRATARWQYVLNRQVVDKMSSAADAQAALAANKFPMPKGFAKDSSKSGYIGYLVDLATNNMLRSGISHADLDKGGYTIYTTFDKKAMQDMKDAVDSTFKGKLDKKRTVVNTVDDKGTAQYGKSYQVDAWLHAGGASVKPGDGAVTAIYGGPDYLKQQFDDADNPGVLVGSTFKAFVLTAALEYGVQSNNQGSASPGAGLSLDTLYNGNNKLKIRNADGTLWTDKNGPWVQVNDSGENLGPVNLKKAMAESINTVYVQLGMDVGMDKVKDAAIQAGLSTSTQWGGLGPSFALGTSTPGPIRLAAAYATFAASGMEADPYEVDHYTLDGKTTSLKSKPKRAFSSDVADSVTTALKAVVNGGTGEKAKALGWDAAGKTGTTDSKRSAWFVGYTKTLSTAIGLWDQNPKDHSFWPLVGLTGKTKIYGADYPTSIWTTYMKAVLDGETPVDLPTDPHYGVVQNESGVHASPTASPSASASVSASPTDTPTPTATSTQGNGNGNGNGNGGWNGGTGPSPSASSSTCILGFCSSGGGNGNGNGNGGSGGSTATRSASSSASSSASP